MTIAEALAITMPAMLRSGGTCRINVKLDSYTMYNASATKHAPTVLNAVRSGLLTP
jgi:hypothetical protein